MKKQGKKNQMHVCQKCWNHQIVTFKVDITVLLQTLLHKVDSMKERKVNISTEMKFKRENKNTSGK